MDITGAPKDAWLLCLEYVADVLNLTYNESMNSIPLQKLTGQTQDCSILLLFKFWQPVYISRHETKFPSSNEIKGRFAGFSKHVGHAYTYKVLTDDTRKIVHRSRLRPVKTIDNKIVDIRPDDTSIKQFIHSKQDQSNANNESNLRPLPTLPKIDPEDCLGRTVLMPK